VQLQRNPVHPVMVKETLSATNVSHDFMRLPWNPGQVLLPFYASCDKVPLPIFTGWDFSVSMRGEQQ